MILMVIIIIVIIIIIVHDQSLNHVNVASNLEIIITVWVLSRQCQQIFECIDTASSKHLRIHCKLLHHNTAAFHMILWRRRFHIDNKVYCEEAHPYVALLSRWGLNTIKTQWLTLWLKLARWPGPFMTCTFNRLGQYASSPGNRAYCYA